jgi:uncharacterized membrane protein
MKTRMIFPSAALVIVTILIIVTLRYPYKAKLFPLLVAFPVAVLLVVNIVTEALGRSKLEVESENKTDSPKDTLFKYLAVAAWMIAFALLIYFSGYLVGVPVFLFLYLKLHGEKWPAAIIYVLIVTVFVYGVFELLFNIQLYKGVFIE